jgi:hypothetical protein
MTMPGKTSISSKIITVLQCKEGRSPQKPVLRRSAGDGRASLTSGRREASIGSKPGDLKPFQFDRDGTLEEFDFDHEELLFIIRLKDLAFHPLEGAVDDPGKAGGKYVAYFITGT